MSTFRKIKEWYKLARPHKGYMCGMFLTALIMNCMPIIQAIPNARVITSLTTLNYTNAVIWLLLSLACVFIYYLSRHLNYKFYYLQKKYIVVNLDTQLYNKISSASDFVLHSHSVEKIMLVTTSNLSSIDNFTDHLTLKSCYIIRAFITIIIVACYNLLMGGILLAVTILLYFWYVYLGKLAQKHTQNVATNREKLGEKITDVVEGRMPAKHLNLKDLNKKQYLSQVDKIVASYKDRGLVNVTRKYWTYAVLYVITTALTVWLAVLTHANALSLSVYLIIAPYFISVIDQAKNGYEMLYELEVADVARMRIQTILNMPSSDIINFSNNTTDKLTNNLVFSNVTYVDTNLGANKTGTLNKTNFEIEPNTITLIKGATNCGKRSLFYMLRRVISPTTGTITMDGINIYDFNKNTYKHNLSYATSKPYFYSESIIENLQYVCPSKNKIIKVCKQLDIHKHILLLPNEYDTNLVKEKEIISPYLLFMLGLARAVLSNSEWICIYEFPLSLTAKQQNIIKEHLLKLKATHSIIIFSAGDSMQDICDNYYTITSGHVRKLNKVED